MMPKRERDIMMKQRPQLAISLELELISSAIPASQDNTARRWLL